jgi:hypothetical protein
MSSTETHGGPHDIRSKREFGGEEERVGISVLQVILFINALEKERFVRVLLTQSRQSQKRRAYAMRRLTKGRKLPT